MQTPDYNAKHNWGSYNYDNKRWSVSSLKLPKFIQDLLNFSSFRQLGSFAGSAQETRSCSRFCGLTKGIQTFLNQAWDRIRIFELRSSDQRFTNWSSEHWTVSKNEITAWQWEAFAICAKISMQITMNRRRIAIAFDKHWVSKFSKLSSPYCQIGHCLRLHQVCVYRF